MPQLVLGPVLRYVGKDDATVWVETDQPCVVEVLGHGERTFTVEGHHYGLVCVGGLRPGDRIPTTNGSTAGRLGPLRTTTSPGRRSGR